LQATAVADADNAPANITIAELNVF
jgi:hypothetical protein